MSARSRSAVSADAVPGAVRTLAVLLQAGSPPADAWKHLASTGEPAACEILRRSETGKDLVDAIAEQGGRWPDVAAAWEVASTVGAPLADTLRTLAESLQDAVDAADDVRVALAEPAATARLMMWLPLAGLLLGLALGFDTLSVIVGTVPGVLCVLAGVGLILLSRRWTAHLVARAQPSPESPWLHAELLAIALSGGTSIDRARRLVRDAAGTAATEETEKHLALSRAAGIPAVELLRAAAAQQRHSARIEGRMRASTLSSRLLLPLGACTLPAFLLLGIAPLILSVLGSTPLFSSTQ